MDKYFIGWSGNQPLALELAGLMNSNTRNRAIVGGGRPQDMHIGAQVLNQIQESNFAILLVEDKNGEISPNLMFEWGYLMARLPINNIYTFLINKQPRDLPSDLLGTWVFEIKADRDRQTDAEIAAQIFGKLMENIQAEPETNYFDLVNDWRRIFSRLCERTPLSDNDLCRYLIAGCIAAYYYMDYNALRHELNNMVGTRESGDIIAFAKTYIDVFIESDNMMHPLSEVDFFRLSQNFDMAIDRVRDCGDEIELLVDILCYDAYALAHLLFLRNEGLDDDTVQFCSNRALELFEKCDELIGRLESNTANNKCLIQLLRAYIYNDLAHLHKDRFDDREQFTKYLERSVSLRRDLHKTFVTCYSNSFLSIKFEQEYIIALSEQCIYMEDSFNKRMSRNIINNKLKDWERELLFTSSLTERIKANISKF